MAKAPKPQVTDFQRKCARAAHAGLNGSSSLDQIARRVKSNRLAVFSAMRALQKQGFARNFRSGNDQWAILLFCITESGLDLIREGGSL